MTCGCGQVNLQMPRLREPYDSRIVDKYEPILILFLGVIVAGILISMYLPIFDLVNVVGTNQRAAKNSVP
jgi:hypothetical protein